MVPSVSDIKEMVSTIGFPTTAVLMVISAFNWGFVPSKLTEIRDDTLTAKVKAEHQQQLMERMIAQSAAQQEQNQMQHIEQMRVLTAALKQICINTSKTERRVDDCLKIDSHLAR